MLWNLKVFLCTCWETVRAPNLARLTGLCSRKGWSALVSHVLTSVSSTRFSLPSSKKPRTGSIRPLLNWRLWSLQLFFIPRVNIFPNLAANAEMRSKLNSNFKCGCQRGSDTLMQSKRSLCGGRKDSGLFSSSLHPSPWTQTKCLWNRMLWSKTQTFPKELMLMMQ